MKKRVKKITATSTVPAPQPGPSLLEFWRALKSGASVAEASGAAPAETPPAAAAPASLGSALSPAAPAATPATPAAADAPEVASSGSGGGGYGLGLIVPDPASQERIRMIMKALCEKDAKRNKT